MQTAPAPSRSRLLGSLKSSFTVGSGPVIAAATSPQNAVVQPLPPNPVITAAPAPEVELTNDQKLELFESVIQEVEAQQIPDVVPAAPTTPSLLLQIPVTTPQANEDAPTVVTPTPAPVPEEPPIQAQAAPQPVIDPASAVVAQPTPVPQPTETPVEPPVVSPEASVEAQAQPAPVVPQPVVASAPQPQADQPVDTTTLSQIATSIDPNQINTLNPPMPVSTPHKEAIGGSSFTLEAGAGSTAGVEIEPQKEISPEVESYIQKVEENDQLPQEIVIADGNVSLSPVQYPAQPVLVLPITPEIEAEAEKKNETFSVKWLKEWCHKLIKMFAGKVIYRQE